MPLGSRKEALRRQPVPLESRKEALRRQPVPLGTLHSRGHFTVKNTHFTVREYPQYLRHHELDGKEANGTTGVRHNSCLSQNGYGVPYFPMPLSMFGPAAIRRLLGSGRGRVPRKPSK